MTGGDGVIIPLHVHSAYSLLTSPMSIAAYVQSAKAKGYTHIGLADTNVLYGVLEFYRTAQAAGLVPLIGMTLSLPSPIIGQTVEEWLIYACSYAGYQQLMQLSTLMKTTDTIDYAMIRSFIEDRTHHEDWVVILGAQFGAVMNHLKQGNPRQAEATVRALQQVFDPEQLYLGVSPRPEDQYHTPQLQAISTATGVPLLVTPYVEYVEAQDYFVDQVMHAIRSGETMTAPKVVKQQVGSASLLPPEDYEAWAKENQLNKALTPMPALGEQLTFTMPGKRRLLPRFPIPDDQPVATYLKAQAERGLAERLGMSEATVEQVPAKYRERLQQELSTIHEMGFDDYFLIVWDVMRYAHETKIRTGPGRGSAAGSLVAYALGITAVDPIQNHLLFERFLNPQRQNMPDIDLDFPDNKRNQIVEYVYQRYGADHVAQISTFGTFQARQALRDVGNVLGADQDLIKQWSQAIAHHRTPLKEAYAHSEALQQLVNQVPYGKLWLETAEQIEGLPRHVSTHAAGVIISDAPLTEYVPLQSSQHFHIHQSQFTKDDVEGLGLLKMDFLSLINLTILDDSIHAAEKLAHHVLDPLQFDRNDARVYELFAQGDTLGIFQFESAGIRRVLQRLKPTSMEDVAAVNALYRPGPMKQIEHFIRRKHGAEPITYPDPTLEPILAETYGIMVYQEQVMQVAQVVAGFSLGEADILRRAMSKKNQAEMTRMQAKFRQGGLANGYNETTIQTIFNYIAEFADYGFNKSHAYAYAYLAYQLAWLKVHYPTAFYYGNVKNVQSFEKKGVQLLKEAEMRHVVIVAPDIKSSFDRLRVKDQSTLQLGISNINGIPQSLSYAIVTERQQGGQYQDLLDFVRRLPKRYVNTKSLLPLVKAGALDDFGYTRHALVDDGLERVCEYVEMFRPAVADQTALPLSQDYSYAKDYAPTIPNKEEYPTSQLAAGEVETLGQAIKTKLYQDYLPYYQSQQLTYIEAITANGKTVQVIGEIVTIKRIMTKKNDPMAFLTLRDESGAIEVTVFPTDYVRFASALHEGTAIFLTGRPQERHQRLQLIASAIKPLGEAVKEQLEHQRPHSKQTSPRHGYAITVASRQVASAKKPALLELLQTHPGPYPLYFTMTAEQEAGWLAKRFQLSGEETVLAKLQTLYGNENVRKW